MDSGTCLELAIEGERLCKAGDFRSGVSFFEAAIRVGTQDKKVLSAIYSQLGNGYFYLSEHEKAMDYHKLDLTLAKSMGDKAGEAKASGNLGNTLKMLGRFEEAIACCETHLKMSKELDDEIGQGRALYNLGNVYHTQAKQLAKLGLQDPGDFPEEVKSCLRKAVEYYELNLEMMIKLGDKLAQGRALGNLGNSHYLLGNFEQAISYHKERLRLAQEFGDKAAERRAKCNLGNAHIFLGKFEEAVNYYKETLTLAEQLKDRLGEAQACYSLGNTYTLLRDFESAIKYHMRYLKIAQEMKDRVAEGRAYWSLGSSLSAVGRYDEALQYAEKHLEISREVGDKVGEATAHMSIKDINKLRSGGTGLATVVAEPTTPSTPSLASGAVDDHGASSRSGAVEGKLKRFSMERMELLTLTPEQKQAQLQTIDEITSSNTQLNLAGQSSLSSRRPSGPLASSSNRFPSTVSTPDDSENFFDLLMKFQSKRYDDQRYPADPLDNKENHSPSSEGNPLSLRSNSTDARLGQLSASSNSIGAKPKVPAKGRNPNPKGVPSDTSTASTSGCSSASQGSNRNNPGHNNRSMGCRQEDEILEPGEHGHGHGDELFDLITSMQSRRMDEQRAALPQHRRNSATNGPESLPGCSAARNPNRHVAFRAPNNQPLNNNSGSMPSRQMSVGANVMPDEDFFDMLMRCQSNRLEDQRSQPPNDPISSSTSQLRDRSLSTGATSSSASSTGSQRPRLERPASMPSQPVEKSLSAGAEAGPDEDFFSLVMRMQSGRIEEQRSELPGSKEPVGEEEKAEEQAAVKRQPSSSSHKSTSSSFKSGGGSLRKSAKSKN